MVQMSALARCHIANEVTVDLQRLEQKVAIVTGASSGIGRATAIAFASAGATVVVNHLPSETSRAQADAAVRDIADAGGHAIALAADISREDQVDAMFAETVDRFGRLDILVNNAGIERPSAIQSMTLADWQAVIDVNLTGQFLCSRAAVRAFLKQQKGESALSAIGTIIFVSSVHAIIPWAFQSNYAASKGGVSLLMQSLAQELAPMKIRVNAVAPGAIRTPINREVWDSDAKMTELLKLIPYGRIGEPEDIGRAVVWLASAASDYVTGTTLFVDGGMTLYPAFRGAG
jgi:glucose 1-dehydrogenase